MFVDTTGWAFTYPLAKLAGCKVSCYTHYPTVSTNMLGRVWSQQAMYNNDDSIRSSTVKSLIKVLYYQLFALVYGLAGACAGMFAMNLLGLRGGGQLGWCGLLCVWHGRGLAASCEQRVSQIHLAAARHGLPSTSFWHS